MDSDTIWRHVDHERSVLADILAGLPEQAWAERSLCEAWTVRNVGAHLTFAQARIGDVLAPLLKAGFRFDAMIRETALKSPLSHDEIISTIRGFRGSRRLPPIVSELEPLADVLIHTQDICVPLGIEHAMPLDAAVVAADRLLALPRHLRLRAPYRGVRFEATDADWSWGAGETVRGPMQWLLLTVAGRTAAHEHLSGNVDAMR